MREQSPLAFTDLEVGDELLLMDPLGRGDLDAIAIVLSVYDQELLVHWVELDENTTGQASLLGMHRSPNRNEPFGQRFVAGVLHVEKCAHLLYLNREEKAQLEPLGYVRVRRRGTVIYEAGENPRTQGDQEALPRLSSS